MRRLYRQRTIVHVPTNVRGAQRVSRWRISSDTRVDNAGTPQRRATISDSSTSSQDCYRSSLQEELVSTAQHSLAVPQAMPAAKPPPPPLWFDDGHRMEKKEDPRPVEEVVGAPVLHEEGSSRDISTALFGLSDFNTSLLTYPNPEDRVAMGMELFPLAAKQDLFITSGWIAELSQSLAADEDAKEADSEAAGDKHALNSSSALPQQHGAVLTFADVLGRSKAIRFFLRAFLAQPNLWHDAVQELLDLAVGHIVMEQREAHLPSHVKSSKMARQDRERLDDVISASSVRLSDHILQPKERVVFYSPALKSKLHALIDDSTAADEVLTGPVAAWDAYVVTHRQDASLLVSPQNPPFSFGETTPSIALNDVERRQFTSSVSQERELVEHIKERRQHSRQLAQHAEKWDSLSEVRQNELLFGVVASSGAEIKKEATSSGIYIVDVSEDVVFSDMDATAQAPTDTTAGGGSGSSLSREDTAGREDEMARSQVYKVDNFLLGIVEPLTENQEIILKDMSHSEIVPDAPLSTPDPLEEEAVCAVEAAEESAGARKKMRSGKNKAARALANEHLPGGCFRQAVTGVIEDVHLSKLWEGFQKEESSALLDVLITLRGCAYSRVQHEIRLELATQAAFLLLFFSRDEVRALTPPQDTYARLWALHAELTDLLRPIVSKEVESVMPWDTLSKSPPLVPFEQLSLSSQASYTCFGAVHLPNLRVRRVAAGAPSALTEGALEVPDAMVPEPQALPTSSTTRGPHSLYTALAETHPNSRKEESKNAAPGFTTSSLQQAFHTLSDQQHFAVAFPFPLTEAEKAEVAGRCFVHPDGKEESNTVGFVEVGELIEESVEEIEEEDSSLDDAVAAMQQEFASNSPSVALPPQPGKEASLPSTAALRAQIEAEVRAKFAPMIEQTINKLLAEMLAKERQAAGTDTEKRGVPAQAPTPETVPHKRRGRGRPRLSPTEKKLRKQLRVKTAKPSESTSEKVQSSALPPSRPRGRPPKSAISPVTPRLPAPPTIAAVDDHYTDDVGEIMAAINEEKRRKPPKTKRNAEAASAVSGPSASAKKKRGRPRKAKSESVLKTKSGNKTTKKTDKHELDTVTALLKKVGKRLAVLSKKNT